MVRNRSTLSWHTFLTDCQKVTCFLSLLHLLSFFFSLSLSLSCFLFSLSIIISVLIEVWSKQKPLLSEKETAVKRTYLWALQMFTKSLKVALVSLHPRLPGCHQEASYLNQQKRQENANAHFPSPPHFLTATGSLPRQSCRSLSISLTTSSASTDSRPRSLLGWSSCSRAAPISLESRLALECTSAKTLAI